MMRTLISLTMLLALAAGCDEERERNPCSSGDTASCTCADGSTGSMVCDTGQFADEPPAFGDCQCANNPVNNPTNNPVNNPTNNPANNPTNNPANNPTNNPTNNPANNPTNNPANNPTNNPDAQPPSIDSLDADRGTLTPAQTLTVRVEVSDPQGAHTVFGGELVDVTAGDVSLASFALDSPGTWTATVGWLDFHTAMPVEFGAGGSAPRQLRAVFADLSGNEASATVSVALVCDDPLEGASGGACAPPLGPVVESVTVDRTTLAPGQSTTVRATVTHDPDFPPGPLTARLTVAGGTGDVGTMTEGPAGTFTGTTSWEALNSARPISFDDVGGADARYLYVAVTDARGQRGTDSVNVRMTCTDPVHIGVDGLCAGECYGGVNRCEHLGIYGSECYPNADFCWWPHEENNPSRGDNCNEVCANMGLRCDESVGYPDGYIYVAEDCYGSPECYGSRGRDCGWMDISGDLRPLECICVR